MLEIIQDIPLSNRLKFCLDLLIELGGNIHQCDRIYQQYWTEQSLISKKHYIEKTLEVKKYIVENFVENKHSLSLEMII